MEYNLIQIIGVLTSEMARHEEKILESSELAGFTLRQLNVLEAIAQLRNPTLSELAEELRITKPSVSVLADKLETLGAIRRVLSDEDKRVSHIHLTAKGEDMTAFHARVHEHLAEHFTRNLDTGEVEALTGILNKVIESFRDKK